MPDIFKLHAPRYWAANLPAIPLLPNEKRPAITRWQTYCDVFPTVELQNNWLKAFPTGNIGLPMGPVSGLVAIDIDSEDSEVLKVLGRILPPSPWHRVGRKGQVQIYRWSGERTARIKHDDGSMICEILSKGTQFVLPPSIHPDTKMPYTADGNLWDIAKDAPPLPMDFEKTLKQALKEAGINVSTGSGHKTLNYVPAGSRDATMVWHAGLLARGVLRGERSLLQVLGEMQAWVENFVEEVVGDPLTVAKAQGKIVEFLIKDVTSGVKALPLGWDEGMSEEDLIRLGMSFTEDDKSWSAQAITDEVMAEFERFSAPHSAGRSNAITFALSRIARRNPPMPRSDEDMILKHIVSASLGTRALSGLRKDLADMRRGDITGETHTEIAKACLEFLGKYGEVRWDAGHMWQWRGSAWVSLYEDELLKIIAETYGGYPAGRRYSDHLGIFKVMKSLGAGKLRTSYVKGVNFANGFLTEKVKLVPHELEFGMTYTLPYCYTPEGAGHMPMFNQFLSDCWSTDPDYGDKCLALQEMIGVSLMRQAPGFQRAFLLYGQAGAGKSVLQTVIRDLLPANSWSAVAPSDWGDRFLPAELSGKVVNFAGELSETRLIPGDIFKKVVSGEEMQVQFKNQNPFVLNPECAHWFNSNHLPKTRDSSAGFTRRWLILEFNQSVRRDKRVVDLGCEIVEHEREAIVAWAIEGYERLVKNGEFTVPTSHLALVDHMANDNNSVREFLTSNGNGLKFEIGKEIAFVDLYQQYWHYSIAACHVGKVTTQKFATMMKELSGPLNFRVEVTGNKQALYRGIGIDVLK